MTQELDEYIDRIKPKLKWQNVTDISRDVHDFPFADFQEISTAVGNGTHSIGINYMVASAFARSVYGSAYAFLTLSGWGVGLLLVIVSLIAAIALSNWWLLIGCVLPFVALSLSSPYSLGRSFFLKLLGIVLCIIFLFIKWFTSAYLIGTFILPFIVESSFRLHDQRRLIQLALEYEPLFIYLYQVGNLGILDKRDHSSHWYSSIAR